MVEEGCAAIEGADLESLPEEDNTVSDGRYRCQMRQFVHRAPSHPLQVAPVSALVPKQTKWREYADEGRDLDGWSERFASHT